jgi:hypothetical protein
VVLVVDTYDAALAGRDTMAGLTPRTGALRARLYERGMYVVRRRAPEDRTGGRRQQPRRAHGQHDRGPAALAAASLAGRAAGGSKC